MDRDDETPTGTGPTKPNVAGTTALVAQLGERLRALYAEVEAEPIPERLRQLLDPKPE